MTSSTSTDDTQQALSHAPSESSSHPSLSRQDSKLGSVDSRFCCNICLDAVVEPVVTQCGHLYCWPCLYRWLEPGMQPEERASLGLLLRPSPIDSGRRVCPVCKASSSVLELVPIYVRSHEPGSQQEDNTSEQRPQSMLSDQNGEELINDLPSNTASAGVVVSANHTGLRQRLRFRNRDSDTSVDHVPSRPAAASPRPSPSSPAASRAPQYRNNNLMTPLSPNRHRASLSHGILLSFQQATSSAVPPLHRRNGAAGESEIDVRPDATEYLSRLLIMLASFVILCLLIL